MSISPTLQAEGFKPDVPILQGQPDPLQSILNDMTGRQLLTPQAFTGIGALLENRKCSCCKGEDNPHGAKEDDLMLRSANGGAMPILPMPPGVQ